MTLSRRRRLTFGLAALVVSALIAVWSNGSVSRLLRGGFRGRAHGVFEVAPYLQPGENPDGTAPVLLWQTSDVAAEWSIALRTTGETSWVASPATFHRIAVDGVPPFRLYRAPIAARAAANGFAYRVQRGDKVEFEAAVAAPKPAARGERFVVFGDGAADSDDQRAVAFQASRLNPDYVVITGDVVYMRGRVSEYLDHFFPVYNADEAASSLGAPLLRSTPFYPAPGNHDLIESDLAKFPDGAAYFYYWSLPLNGPTNGVGAPQLKGPAARQQAYRDAVGPAFPRVANYSVDRGGIHWTVLDSSPYADWNEPTLRAWLEADLASPSARAAHWRFVACHHPPFSSSKAHADDQRMRVLAPVFESAGVSVVFNGHVHNYQRSRPIKFSLEPLPLGKTSPYGPSGQVPGRWTLDTTFDGVRHTKPDGVIYLVTGAGGARLYNPDQTKRPESWYDFTARFISDIHSLTVVDATPDSLILRQISFDGHEIDRAVVTK